MRLHDTDPPPNEPGAHRHRPAAMTSALTTGVGARLSVAAAASAALWAIIGWALS